MRLFEVDLGSVRSVLAVLQGQADQKGEHLTLPFATVMKIIRPFGLGINTVDGLIAFKNKQDPEGDVMDVKDDGTVIIKTKKPNPEQEQGASQGAGAGPSVDAMASSGAKNLSPNI